MNNIDHIYPHYCTKAHVCVEVLTQGNGKKTGNGSAVWASQRPELKVTGWKSITWLAHLIDRHFSMNIDSTLSNLKAETSYEEKDNILTEYRKRYLSISWWGKNKQRYTWTHFQHKHIFWFGVRWVWEAVWKEKCSHLQKVFFPVLFQSYISKYVIVLYWTICQEW